MLLRLFVFSCAKKLVSKIATCLRTTRARHVNRNSRTRNNVPKTILYIITILRGRAAFENTHTHVAKGQSPRIPNRSSRPNVHARYVITADLTGDIIIIIIMYAVYCNRKIRPAYSGDGKGDRFGVFQKRTLRRNRKNAVFPPRFIYVGRVVRLQLEGLPTVTVSRRQTAVVTYAVQPLQSVRAVERFRSNRLVLRFDNAGSFELRLT